MYCSKHDKQRINLRNFLDFNSWPPNLVTLLFQLTMKIVLVNRVELLLPSWSWMISSSCPIMSSIHSRTFSRVKSKARAFSQFPISYMLPCALVGLDETGFVCDEIYEDIPHGFTKCSNEDFKAVFKHLLTQDRINHSSSYAPTGISFYSVFYQIYYCENQGYC